YYRFRGKFRNEIIGIEPTNFYSPGSNQVYDCILYKFVRGAVWNVQGIARRRRKAGAAVPFVQMTRPQNVAFKLRVFILRAHLELDFGTLLNRVSLRRAN